MHPSSVSNSEIPGIDTQALAAHMEVLFSYCDGHIPLRAFPEKGNAGGRPHLEWIPCNGNMAGAAARFCDTASASALAAYVIPGTVEQSGKASAQDIRQMQTVLVDLDDGDVEAKCRFLSEHIGTPTLVVESGGVTAEGQSKLHLYWKLSEPAEMEDLRRLVELRLLLAEKAGGDRHFASAHQPIRLAGSVYRKHGVIRIVRIREQHALEYHLHELIEHASLMAWFGEPKPATATLDFNDAKPPIDTVLTARVRENGIDGWTRFEGISRVIGHWLRRYHEGAISQERAKEEIYAYNAACLIPPWPPERVQAEIERLWKKHCAEYGEPKPQVTQPVPPVEYFTARQTLTEPATVPFDIIGPRVLTPGGLWLIAGPPKVGKSDFLLSLFSHAAAGLDFLCFTVNRPLRVFYAQAELERPYLQERYQRIIGGQPAFESGLDNLVMTSRFHFQLDEAGVAAIADAANNAFGGKVDIIALDPFRNLFQAGLSGGDVNAELIAFFRLRMEKLLAMTSPDAGLVLVHHTNKIPGKMLVEDPMAAISGGGAMLSYPSALMVMNRAEHEERPGVTCWFDLRYGPPLPTSTFVRDGSGWQETARHDMRLVRQQWGQRNDEEQSRRRYNILTFLYEEALEGRLYNAESLSDTLAGRMGLGSGKTIRGLVRQYETKGFIRFIGNNHAAKYGLPKTRSKYGYLCVEGMKHEAAGDAPESPYLPTHYRCPHSSQIFELKEEDVHRWQYDMGDDA